MQQRTAEETEAAHDLLQLAYYLPPTQTIMPEDKQRPSVMTYLRIIFNSSFKYWLAFTYFITIIYYIIIIIIIFIYLFIIL